MQLILFYYIFWGLASKCLSFMAQLTQFGVFGVSILGTSVLGIKYDDRPTDRPADRPTEACPLNRLTYAFGSGRWLAIGRLGPVFSSFRCNRQASVPFQFHSFRPVSIHAVPLRSVPFPSRRPKPVDRLTHFILHHSALERRFDPVFSWEIKLWPGVGYPPISQNAHC